MAHLAPLRGDSLELMISADNFQVWPINLTLTLIFMVLHRHLGEIPKSEQGPFDVTQ